MTALDERPATAAPTPHAPLVRVKTRGYYKDSATGERYTSVTTILGRNIEKGALIRWSANTVAKCAMDNLPYLAGASRVIEDRIEAYDWLRAAAERTKEERAGIGTAVHALIESKILGTPMPPEFATDEMKPYLANFEAFVREWQVTFTASEMIVGHSKYKYAGTLDFLMASPLIARELDIAPHLEISGDVKTGGELDVKGVYPEAALQMSAYGHADFAQLRDGSRVPMPATAPKGVVLHLRPEGYRIVEAAVGDDVFAQFLALRVLDEQWTTGLSKRVLGRVLNQSDKGEE